MQKIQMILGIFLCLTGLFSGCSKDEGLSPEQIRYGKADTVSLGIVFRNTEPEEVKGAVNVNEAAVNDVNVYVFNELGDVISHRYATGSTSLSGMAIYQNMHYRIYAIANAGESLPCRTVAEIEAVTRSITHISQVADASGGVLMCGKTSQMILFDGQQVPVNLERCVSKFILQCDYSQLSPGVQVTVKRVQLRNAPNTIRLFGESRAVGGAVMDGEERTGADLNDLSGSGVHFYLFENLQGTVAPAALDNKSKEQQMNAMAKANSSYMEMEYTYLSPEKEGTIVYRFYLGKTFADCDVKRNTQYRCTVLFKGNGSAGENSWSVDNSRLVDRVTGILLNPASHTFKAFGETLQIRATILPVTANNQTLSWVSSNPAIATVNAAGLVTAVADGTCTITATSTDGTNVSASCSIRVDSKVPVTSISVTPTSLVLFAGASGQLSATLLPAHATVPGVAWSSSNPAVATVDLTGKVAAVKGGTVDITAMSVDDNSKKAVCKVTVQDKELTIHPVTKTLYVGERFSISYTVKPPVLPSFTSSAAGVATVDANGAVTAVGVGTANITVSAHGLTAVCTVTVVKPEVAFPYPTKTMYDGEVVEIPYSSLVPNTAIPVASSSAEGVVEILETTSSGVKVKAITVGNATITASIGGVSASCMITVEKLQIRVPLPLIFAYTHFNTDIKYTITPAHAASLGVVASHVNASDATYFIFPDANIPNRIQGKMKKQGLLPIKLSINGRPDVSITIYCSVSPGLAINDKEFLTGTVDILANAYVSKQKNKTYPDIYVKRQVSYTAAPQAKVIWECNKPGVIVDKGLIYTSDTSPANGPGYYITASVTGDDGEVISFTNARGITFYEEIYLEFEGIGNFVGEDGSSGEMLPLFEVFFRNTIAGEMPGAPIKKEVFPDGLKFNDRDWTYNERVLIYGAAGDTDYIMRVPVVVKQKGEIIKKYKEPSNGILKYFISY